jgi:hypothetical protein
MVTEAEMIDFENEIANLFNTKQIKSPIHLYHGNEKQMLKMIGFFAHGETIIKLYAREFLKK